MDYSVVSLPLNSHALSECHLESFDFAQDKLRRKIPLDMHLARSLRFGRDDSEIESACGSCLPPGRYVVAVSGGVDSVVLLHLLVQQHISSQFTVHSSQINHKSQAPSTKFQINSKLQTLKRPTSNIQLTVAHFDHGIRPDSAKDRQFVQELAESYGLTFVYDRAELGAGASEATARAARYAFLTTVKQAVGADAIITAHHQDDVLETIIINWLRGTKSRGLSSLRSTAEIRRPLLGMTKKQIQDYAHLHTLQWCEDSTNTDETYLRNYIRRRIVPGFDPAARAQLLAHSTKAAELNEAIGQLTEDYLAQHTTPRSIDRVYYTALPQPVSREILAEWLRRHTPATITAKTLMRLDAALRTGRTGSQVDIAKGFSFALTRTTAQLKNH